MGKRPLLFVFAVILLICCFIKPKQSPMERLCKDQDKGRLKGVITSIKEKESSLEITVKNGTFQHTDTKKRCLVSKILVYYKEKAEPLRIGNKIFVTGSVLMFKKPTNLGQFNEYDYYKEKKYDCKMYADSLLVEKADYNWLKEKIRGWKNQWKQVYESQLPSSQSGIVEAMVLGEKENLEDGIKKLYQKNGIGHIMAISGLHISFLGLGLYKLFKRVGLPEWITVSLSSVFLLFYGLMTGFSVSATRAILMLMLALCSRLVGRTYDMLTAMAISGIFILIRYPLQVRSCSFLLTFGAVFGIGFVCPILKEIVNSKSTYADNLLAGISVQVMILPITAYFFYEIPLYGIIINLFILPFMSFLLILSIAAVLCFFLSPLLGKFIFGSVHGILWYYEKICYLFEKLPNSNVVIGKPLKLQILIYFIFITAFLILIYSYKKSCKYVIYCIPCFVIFLFPVPTHHLNVTMLDVGQGDSIFFRTGRLTYLMDGGSSDIKKVGEYRILPFLKASGVETLHYMIISHTDKDHISGLIELLEEAKEQQFRIKTLLLPKIANPDDAYKKIERLAKQSHINILYLEQGKGWKKENLSVTCLHPNKNFLEVDKNECSTILSLQYGAVRILLTGDVEEMGEEEILPFLQEHQILKVAHHGSNTSSTEAFLEKVKPKIALISCGKNNSYGHPHKEVLERMEERNSKIYNTSMDGAVHIEIDGRNIKIQRFAVNAK